MTNTETLEELLKDIDNIEVSGYVIGDIHKLIICTIRICADIAIRRQHECPHGGLCESEVAMEILDQLKEFRK